MTKDNHSSDAKLRQKAEEIFKERYRMGEQSLSESEMWKIIHDMSVRLAELELQNEEFTKTIIAEQNNNNKYVAQSDPTYPNPICESLQVSEERWKYALEGATDGMWDWDIETNRVFFSTQWKAMLGFDESEIGDTLDEWKKRVHPNDLETVLLAIERNLRGETSSYSSEHRVLCKDGSYKWVLDEGKVVKRDDSGKAVRAIGTHKDITFRKNIEYDLRERMKELSIHNRISVLMSSTHLSFGEVIQKTVELIPGGWRFPEDTEALIQIHDTVFKTEGYTTTGYPLKCDIKVSDIVIGTVEVCSIKEKTSDSNSAFLPEETDLLFSIAERLGSFIGKNANNLLLIESEQKYRDLVENISEVIYRIDNKGVITYISSSIEKIIGFTAQEITGRSFTEFVGVNSEFLSQRLKELSAKKELFNEYKLLTKTGESRWVRLSTKAILQDGNFIGANGTIFDISEKKVIEQELQKSESLYRSILQASPDTIFISDLEGRILFTSAMALKMFGYDDLEFPINTPLFDFVDPKNHDKARNAISQMFQGIYTGATEYKGIKADGSTFEMEVNGEFIKDEDGKPVSMVFVVRDISERKIAEEKLRKSEEQYRKLVESVNDVIYEIDATGTIKFVSPSVIRVLGFTVEEVTGRNIFDFIYQEDQSDIMNSFRNLSSREYSYLEYRYVRKDGSIHWVRSSTSSITENGVMVGGTGILTDITERKIAELELVKAKEKTEESERKFIAIIQSQAEGIGIVDKNECFEFVNLAAEKIFETKPGELIGKSLMDFLSAEEKEKINNETSAREQGIENTYDLQIFTEKGNARYIHVSAVPKFNENNDYLGAYGVFQDVTERKKAENALQNSEEKFSKAFQTAPYAISITSVEDGKFFEINDSFTVHTGYTKEEVYADSSIGLKLWANIDDRNSVIADLSQGKDVFAKEYDFVKKSGKRVSCIYSASMILLNKKPYILSSITDISEIKLAQDQLRKLSRAVEQNPASIVITNLEGNIEYANPKACETTGYALNELIGQNPRLLKSGETQATEYEKLWVNISTGNEWRGVFHNKRKNGELYWEASTISPIADADGKITHYLAIKEDITQRKETEEALSKSEEDLNNAQHIARMGSWEHNFITNKLTGSKYYYSMLGLQPFEKKEILFEYFVSLIHPDDLAVFKELQQGVYLKNETKIIDFRIVLPDGKTKWIQNNIVPVYDGGTLVALKGVNIDITEKRLAEEALRTNEAALNQAQEISNMSSWELNMVTEKLTWSKNYYQIMGMKQGTEIKTEFFQERVHPADVYLVNEKLEEIKRTKKPVTYDLRLRMPNLEFRWIQNNIVPEFEDGKLVRLKGVNIDITEKKLAEKKNQLQNQRLSAIIGAMPDLMFVADKNGWYLEYYSSKPDLMAVPDDEIVGANVRDLFEEVSAKLHLLKIDECLQHQKLITYEFSGIDKGSFKYFESRLAPLGKDSVLTFIRDITDAKLKDNEIKKLSLAVEQSPVLIVITDLDGKIEYVNPTVETTTGYSKIELIGQNPRILKSDKTDPEVYARMWQSITGGKQWSGELLNKKKNGELYWESMSITPARNETGKITNYLAIKQDITQRKQAEQEIHNLNSNLEHKIDERTSQLALTNADLQKEIEERNRIQDALSKSEKNYRSVVENVNEVIFKTDADGLWLFLNKSWESITGFTVEESLGKSFANYIHPDDRQRNMELVEPLMKREKEYSRHEVRYITRDGGFRWIEVFSRLSLNENDEVTGTYGTLQDITERKRAEDFEDELLQLSLQLTGIPGNEISSAIYKALNRIGSFLGADRAYIFEFSPTDDTMSNTYEWCNTGINPEIDNLKDIPIEIFPMWMEQLQRYENILIPSVSDLPESWSAEREILEPQGIKSLIVIPVYIDIQLIGFVGLDSVLRHKEYDTSEINILQVWSNMLAGLIKNQRNELTIEQTRRNYETFFNTIDDFLFVLDEQGNILHTNNTVIKRLGYALDELLYKSVLLVHPVDRRDEAGRIVGEMLAGTADFCPVPLLKKNSSQVSVETRVKPGFWDGKPVIFGVSKDVSKIQLSEEKFSRAFQSNSALMAISGFENGEYIDVNDTFLKTLGYSHNEIIGKTSIELQLFAHPEIRTIIIEKLKQNIVVREIEIEIKTKSGAILIGLFSADKIFVNDQQCLLTVMIDITDRKIAEEELKKARIEAEKANLAKSEFLSSMSHELRTPMNSILGFAQLMEMGELIPAHRKGVNHILKSGKHLLDLINEVLDISRIEAGRISLSIEPVRVSTVITEMLDIVQPQVSSRNQTIKLVESTSNQLFVLADNQRLKQVLLNLINNAVKYNNEGGYIHIETELCQSDSAGKSMIRISVMDNGIGIKPEEISKLFLPFERIGAERTETEGTGLGLNVVKKLMEAMDGRVGVSSIPGEGSTFWIELEHVEYQKFLDESAKLAPKQGTKEVLKSGTILYFEDNTSNIELVDGIIENHRPHIQLITSVSGINAVEMAKEYKPDLILLDLDLPEVHGSEVFANLQAETDTRSIPVVIISADAMSHQIKKMLNAGVRDYLTKPIEITLFLKMIDKCILPNKTKQS
ncbi:MAG: PAS domain S-box protein [Bacteroidales bacterium]|nr:PAS domain S-box protein [Bacteroidales bacterium]